jgi:hypothetical protein
MSTGTNSTLLADSKAKCSHTPGPWEILADPDDPSGWVVVDATHERFQVASVEPRVRPTEELANCRLIAAAPDLSAALKRTLSWLTSYPGGCSMPAYNQAVEALKKAGTYE